MRESLRTKKGKDGRPFLLLKMLSGQFLGLLLTFTKLKSYSNLNNLLIKINLGKTVH